MFRNDDGLALVRRVLSLNVHTQLQPHGARTAAGYIRSVHTEIFAFLPHSRNVAFLRNMHILGETCNFLGSHIFFQCSRHSEWLVGKACASRFGPRSWVSKQSEFEMCLYIWVHRQKFYRRWLPTFFSLDF